MNSNPLKELIQQAVALLISIIIVHAMYVAVVRPKASAILVEQSARAAQGDAYQESRSPYVVVKDSEQEACFILMLWAFAIIGMRARRVLRARSLLGRNLIEVPPGTRILPDDVRELSRPIQALPADERDSIVPRALLTGLQRFGITEDVQAVSGAVREVCDVEADRLDSELSMVRYIVWAIPSIGFIGTVRGIGQALSQAHRAIEGDIVGVTTSLGVAFNSTFVALVISILVMFLMYQVQLLQERLVLDTQAYCDNSLTRHLAAR